MPLVYCNSSIVDYTQPEGLVIAYPKKTSRTEKTRGILDGLRSTAERTYQSTELRHTNGDLSTIMGPVALGGRPRVASAGSPTGEGWDERRWEEGGEDDLRSPLPLLPTPPSSAGSYASAGSDSGHTVRLNALPQLTARRPGMGNTPRAPHYGGSLSARDQRKQATEKALSKLRGSRSARGSSQQLQQPRPPPKDRARGHRRLAGAGEMATHMPDPGPDMLVRSEYTGVERNLMEWAVAPQGYEAEMAEIQTMQTGWDVDRMRNADMMAQIVKKHQSMNEWARTESGKGYWDQEGMWKPLPFIGAIRKHSWREASQLLKWSQAAAVKRRQAEDEKKKNKDKTKKAKPAKEEEEEEESYDRPDYAIDTDQNGNTALHHCLAPYQVAISGKRGSNAAKNWHPKGSKGAVGVLHRPPPEFLTELIVAHATAPGQRNRNGLTPLHFALGCTSTEINASVDAILELCDACPSAVKVKNNTAELPLHLAAAKNAPEAVLKKLIEIYPDACLESNCWGSLPLHVGLVNGMPLSQIKVLIDAHPFTVGEVDEDGKTPCAIALSIGAPNSTVLYLVREFPGCLQVPDTAGMTPLALALVNRAPESIVLQLLELDPSTILEANNVLELPLHIAIRHALRQTGKVSGRNLSSRGGSRGSSRGGKDVKGKGMRRTGQAFPIQLKSDGEGYHVPASRGGEVPAVGLQGTVTPGRGGSSSRGGMGLMTPSMQFTPTAIDRYGLDEDTVAAGAGSNRRAMTPRGAVRAGITVTSGADSGFAPGSVAMPSVFGMPPVPPHLHAQSAGHPRFHPPHASRGGANNAAAAMGTRLVNNAAVVSRPGSRGPTPPSRGDPLIRPFSRGGEGYLERVVGALLAADKHIQEEIANFGKHSVDRRRGKSSVVVPTTQATDLHGRTALHVACARHTPHPVIKMIMEADTGAIETPDGEGWLPLHRYVAGVAFAAAPDCLHTVLCLLEGEPNERAVGIQQATMRHPPPSQDKEKKEHALKHKKHGQRIKEEFDTHLMACTSGELLAGLKTSPKSTKKLSHVRFGGISSGRRDAMSKSPQRRRDKAANGKTAPSSQRGPTDAQKEEAAPERGLDVADPSKHRKEEQERLGRQLNEDESLARLAHMRALQEKEKAAYQAKLQEAKLMRQKGLQAELLPCELAANSLKQAIRKGSTSPASNEAASRVVQLLKALTVGEKLLAANVTFEGQGSENPTLTLDNKVSETREEVVACLEMLKEQVKAGLLPEMPVKITARLHEEEAYCNELLNHLVTCQYHTNGKAWERLAIHCDGMLHAPGFRNARIIKVILDEANNQIELACIRMFSGSAIAFDKINSRMDESKRRIDEAKSRHDEAIKYGAGVK